jgi:hypothetical protein
MLFLPVLSINAPVARKVEKLNITAERKRI